MMLASKSLYRRETSYHCRLLLLGSHLKVVSHLTNVFFLSQVRFLRYIHAGNDSEDFVSRIHLSYIRLPEGCVELARFYCRCFRVGIILSNQSTH